MLALIPIKNLSEAKGRLSSKLSHHEKRELVLLMLDNLLDSLEQTSALTNIVVVSKDENIHQHCEQRQGITTLCLKEDTSLNAALQAAKHYTDDKYPTEALLILPGDLPFASPQDIHEIIHAHLESNAQLSICPDHDKKGTNALVLNPGLAFDFHFGDNSFNEHIKQARKENTIINVLSNNNISRDIDTPEQLKEVISLQEPGEKQNMPDESSAQDLVTFMTEQRKKSVIKQDDWQFLLEEHMHEMLLNTASNIRDEHFGKIISYSRKVFIPLTHLCRNVCHYCTFAKTPKKLDHLYMSLDEVIKTVEEAKQLGCKEILFTLGERPELRYPAAKQFLKELGFESTLEYLHYIAEQSFQQTGLLPHINAGCMSMEEMKGFRSCSPSMGLMLENISPRLCEKGMPHHGSPDKEPHKRLETIEAAGKLKIPFTTGILIGIGETRFERIQSLFAINALHEQYGHIQEVIIQNFRAKEETKMVNAQEPGIEDLQWTIAIARLILHPDISVQAPPNLSPENQSKLIEAGINDWGGISPLTPDFVNPEAPWPHIDNLRGVSELSDKVLQERLTVYPKYITPDSTWIDKNLYHKVLALSDCGGFAKTESWQAGLSTEIPFSLFKRKDISTNKTVSNSIFKLVNQALQGEHLSNKEVESLFYARGADFEFICRSADQLRKTINGDAVSYVVNRNINYTNICSYKCSFCAFSKGQSKENLRDKPYRMQISEVTEKVLEAEARGATEVCLQGGIHPEYDGNFYLELCRDIKRACPDMHIHAFSPLEVWQGAHSINKPLASYLQELKQAGLGSLPGTAAEILDDEIRNIICPDKINTGQWLEVIETAHQVGLPTTATIMFGHVENYQHWANHLSRLKSLQLRTGGITEFVPLPFVGSEAPMYKRGLSRSSPSFREAVLMHAISRLYFGKLIPNIQASWVKLGEQGLEQCLHAGVNDLGGTLMNESITRAAGASHGQEFTATKLNDIIRRNSRVPVQRSTLYKTIHKPAEMIALVQENKVAESL